MYDRPVRVQRLAWCAVVVIGACSTTRYRVPLQGPQADEAQACVALCHAEAETSGAYRECLRGCPGATVDSDRCGPQDVEPAAACAEDRQVSPAAILLAVVAAVAVIVLAASAGN